MPRVGTILAAVTEEPTGKILTIEPMDGGLRIIGQVDLSNIDQFRTAIGDAAQGAWELKLDLEECSYMGSEGISTLIETSKTLGEGTLVLRAPSDFLQKVLDLTGIAKLPNVRVEAVSSE
jgi:anti-anti-sigma factor